MNTSMHGPSFFSFHFLSFSNFFPQINHFYYFTSLHGLQDVENHCAHSRDIELKSGRNLLKALLLRYHFIKNALPVSRFHNQIFKETIQLLRYIYIYEI